MFLVNGLQTRYQKSRVKPRFAVQNNPAHGWEMGWDGASQSHTVSPYRGRVPLQSIGEYPGDSVACNWVRTKAVSKNKSLWRYFRSSRKSSGRCRGTLTKEHSFESSCRGGEVFPRDSTWATSPPIREVSYLSGWRDVDLSHLSMIQHWFLVDTSGIHI